MPVTQFVTALYSAYKAANTNVHSSILTNDPDLVTDIYGGVYKLDCTVFVQGSNAATGFQMDLNNTSANIPWSPLIINVSNPSDVSNGNVMAMSSINVGGQDWINIEGTIWVATGGILGIRVAQLNADSKSNVVVCRGSYVSLTKIG